VDYSGPWSVERVGSYLNEMVIPVRLGCVSQAGWPLVLSLWYLHRGGEIWCSTQQGSRIASVLADSPRCAFEIAADTPPYRGVRGRGVASVEREPPAELLPTLIRRYLRDESSSLARWLLSRRSSEVAIRVTPSRMHSWDYTERMKQP
jgi:hypothetical protein